MNRKGRGRGRAARGIFDEGGGAGDDAGVKRFCEFKDQVEKGLRWTR